MIVGGKAAKGHDLRDYCCELTLRSDFAPHQTFLADLYVGLKCNGEVAIKALERVEIAIQNTRFNLIDKMPSEVE